jgi:hypothetical protein
MIDKTTLCEKVRDIYPDIGVCGIDLDAAFDEAQNRWTIWLKKDQHELKTYLEPGDAELCLMNQQCIGLSIEIAQLKGNVSVTA